MMQQKFSINFRLLMAVIIAAYVAYYVLLNDNFLHISISSIIASARHLAVKKHLLVLGLLPIYIAMIIFGSVSVAIYINTRLGQFFADKSKSHV